MSFPQIAQDAVLVNSEPMPSGSEEVRGYDLSNGVNYRALLQSFKSTGFQANHFGWAVDEINRIVSNVVTVKRGSSRIHQFAHVLMCD